MQSNAGQGDGPPSLVHNGSSERLRSRDRPGIPAVTKQHSVAGSRSSRIRRAGRTVSLRQD